MTPDRAGYEVRPDSTSDIRAFAAWMGLVLVAMGVAMACYLFYRVGQVVLDPRSAETQVNRWEFVIRGRATDAFPDAMETGERRIIAPVPARAVDDFEDPAPATSNDPVEETARLMGRLGSKSARAAALVVLLVVLMLLVKICTAIIHAGIRLAGLSGGEREYMKRIVDELVHQRGGRGDS